MDSGALWQRFCEYFRFYPELGISLDISRMRFSESFLGEMEDHAARACSQMAELEQGAIANPDEGRMVGHYWLRNPGLAPNRETGNAIEAGISRIKDFSAKIHSGEIHGAHGKKFQNVLVIGIGGSALGPQLVSDALSSCADLMKLYFCDNTDPDGFARTLEQLEGALDKTLCIVISKSGGTVETRNGQLEVEHAYKEAGLSFASHALCITCEGSKLDIAAKNENYLAQFYIWDWVGGRTSMFSAVGLLPAALQGVDIDAFVEGAQVMDQLTRNRDLRTNPALLLSLMWYAAGQGVGSKDMVIIPYKDRLVLFSKYLQQLVMESLGKESDLDGHRVNQGLAVYGNKGSTDQHAYIQQLREGLNNFFVTFIEVLGDYVPSQSKRSFLEVKPGITAGDYLNGFYQGTRRALFENGRDSITITVDELSAKTLGALIALYDRAVGLYALLIRVNAYHQPGVEAGKKAAENVIDIQQKLLAKLAEAGMGALTASELSEKLGEPSEVETIFKCLEHLASNPERRILRLGERSPISAKYCLAR